MGKKENTSLVAKGALAHRLQNPKWPPGSPKMADGVWKGVYLSIYLYFNVSIKTDIQNTEGYMLPPI